jgi:hypothetical protein
MAALLLAANSVVGENNPGRPASIGIGSINFKGTVFPKIYICGIRYKVIAFIWEFL